MWVAVEKTEAKLELQSAMQASCAAWTSVVYMQIGDILRIMAEQLT